jgi:hypothetical protein
MKINFKKYYYKLFDRDKYKFLKSQSQIEKDTFEFKKNYEKRIYKILENIKTKKILNFIHSGHCGDLIYALPMIKELAKTHKCNFYIKSNEIMPVSYFKHPAGNVYINDRILNLLLPVLKNQSYINLADKYNGQTIDVDLDLFRKLPVNILFNSPRWYFHICGIQVDLSKPYMDVPLHTDLKDKIVIHRTFRYRNDFISYKFLSNYDEIIFIGIKEEFEDLKKDVPNLILYDCKDYLEMASIIKSCRFFIGNQSVAYPIAEALKVPRILEACPYFPVVQPIGNDAFDFYYQPHFEKWCNYLNKKYKK